MDGAAARGCLAQDKDKNPMREIRVEKLILNICVGESGDRLTFASRVLEQLVCQAAGQGNGSLRIAVLLGHGRPWLHNRVIAMVCVFWLYSWDNCRPTRSPCAQRVSCRRVGRCGVEGTHLAGWHAVVVVDRDGCCFGCAWRLCVHCSTLHRPTVLHSS